MQDVQNIPNPDVDSVVNDNDFGSHSEIPPDLQNERGSQNTDVENPKNDIPLPPDSQPHVPVEEPEDRQNLPPIGDDSEDKKERLV